MFGTLHKKKDNNNNDESKPIVAKKEDNNTIYLPQNTAAATLSYSPKLYQKYYNDYREGILEIAKTFLRMLSNQIVDKTMVAEVK